MAKSQPVISDYAKEKYDRMKRESCKINPISMAQAYMPPENAAADPLAQPPSKKLAEQQNVLGKHYNTDKFSVRKEIEEPQEGDLEYEIRRLYNAGLSEQAIATKLRIKLSRVEVTTGYMQATKKSAPSAKDVAAQAKYGKDYDELTAKEKFQVNGELTGETEKAVSDDEEDIEHKILRIHFGGKTYLQLNDAEAAKFDKLITSGKYEKAICKTEDDDSEEEEAQVEKAYIVWSDSEGASELAQELKSHGLYASASGSKIQIDEADIEQIKRIVRSEMESSLPDSAIHKAKKA